MPTYAYACTACGHAFDVVQSITDDALSACPECGGPLRKVFHPVGVTFKGSGFYRTDSRAGGGAASTADTGGAGDSGGGKGEGKGDGKGEGKGSKGDGPAKAPSKDSSDSPAKTPAKDGAASRSGSGSSSGSSGSSGSRGSSKG